MNTQTSQQVNRLNAIEAELAALASQAQALGQIAIEHNHGLDLGSNESVAHYARHAADLVTSLKLLLKRLPPMPQQGRKNAIDNFKATALRLKETIEGLVPQRDNMARNHLEESLADLGEKPACDSRNLAVEAHHHCHAAETTEIRSFVAQFQALSELCLETIFVEGEAASSTD